MSYIDTFDYEFVGYFGGIPVYHPLEVVPASPDDPADFACAPENLVIGGGSGEHPGLVVKDLGEAVDCFVRAWLERLEQNSPDKHRAILPSVEAWPGALAGLRSGREEARYWRVVFEFAGWQAGDYVDFSTRCASRAFHRPFEPREDCLEGWLAASVGEFILFAMPELAQDAIERLGDLRHRVSEGIDHWCYQNIHLLPPGYPVWGRRELDNQVIWGISAWEIQRKQNPRTIRCT